MIEHDKHNPTRLYIQLPGGWEAQTKGKGSSYRLYDAKAGERHTILCADDKRALEFVTRMFVEVHDEYEALKAKLAETERERDEVWVLLLGGGEGPIKTIGAIQEAATFQRDAMNYLGRALKAERERDELQAENERLREALRPFAKAGELFGALDPEGFDILVYGPAAGEEYNIVGNDLRRARAAMTPNGTIPAAKPDQDAGAIPSGITEEADARD